MRWKQWLSGWRRHAKWWQLGLFAAVIAVGIGVLIGRQPLKGLVYALDRPELCASCHVMEPHYESWYHSAHRTVNCNDCHTPHNFIGKWFTKARAGIVDTWVYFIGPMPAQFRAKSHTLEILQDNCIRCHETFVSRIGDTRRGGGLYCFSCHRDVPHGVQTGLSPNPRDLEMHR
ncbi:cytochrome c nitrite reductase small subunit [Heliobacterium gestii]|uniref:Cytochrome c nitrite reductase small subunit n=1 Tax=Heliomicrobium gestii TaxID=2699 RepID=A0A845LBR2_HELGE|nr:cytochrome c nitrite reductase small subunit [Heliomicrobium gestii]MBM7867709.1 cytochrome c nitrite reductase small subunit [Heliomicrobium gestii]MZP44102.1 cytochrome c nitrite reductase small subunit [Heliomicrobium gestii]